MNFHDEYLESISLLQADDPVRIEFEAALAAAPEEVRSQYAQLVAEAQGMREPLETPIPEALMEHLLAIPAQMPRYRHSRFLTRFRAAAAAAIVLMLLAPATAWLLPPDGHHRLAELPAAAVAAVDSPIEVPGTQPSNLGSTFASSPLSFFATLPEPKPGTQFLGGGVTTLVGRPAAFGRYRANHKNFTLFVVALTDFPLSGDGELTLVPTPEGDATIRYWSDGPSASIMVSEPESTFLPQDVLEVRPMVTQPDDASAAH
jgi:hypothetical protein